MATFDGICGGFSKILVASLRIFVRLYVGASCRGCFWKATLTMFKYL